MVTNNFKKILFGGIFCSTSTSYNNPSFGYIELVDTNGNDVNINGGGYGGGQVQSSLVNALNHLEKQESSGALTIKVGTGTTTPTTDDYEIQNEAAGITCDSTSIGFTSNFTKTYTATFSNSTASNVNITELGLFATNSDLQTFLLDRTVLSTPITIPAGESKTITYEIVF